MPETWIKQASTAFGEPHIAISEPVIRPGLHRRCWVWFVGGQNFNIAIDKEQVDRFKTLAGSPGRHAYFYSRDEPTDAQVRELLTFCWPGFAEARDA